MKAQADLILHSLQEVAAERASGTPIRLWLRAWRGQAFPASSLSHTYADLLASPRYGRSAPLLPGGSFRSRGFHAPRRAVRPRRARADAPFPAGTRGHSDSLGELHACREFDTAMARVIDGAALDDGAYAEAWRPVGRPADRERQIELMMRGFGAGPLHPQSLDPHESAADARASIRGRAGCVAGLPGTGFRYLQ